MRASTLPHLLPQLGVALCAPSGGRDPDHAEVRDQRVAGARSQVQGDDSTVCAPDRPGNSQKSGGR